MTSEQEAAAIERWRIQCFSDLDFDWGEVQTLLAWDVDPHDAQHLMRRDGNPTTCTTEQALRILQPVDDPVVLAAERELALA